MLRKKIQENEVVFFDSPEDLPFRRYQRFNKFLMIENEIGSDFADFDKRTEKAIRLLSQGMVKEAKQELVNRRQLVFNAFSEYSPKGRALAILVKSINGIEYHDFTKDGLDLIIDKLNEIGFSQKESTETVEKVKKKSKKN